MDGVRIVAEDKNGTAVIDDVSESLRNHLKARLAEYCFGAATVAEANDAEAALDGTSTSYYSFNRTVVEFLKRYDSKPEATRIGMAGELLVHVLMPHLYPHLVSSAVFFNKEERSIKKGFDVTYYVADDGQIWYGEAKSGKVQAGQSANSKAAALLGTAASDIANKLSGDTQESRWDSALIDAGLTLQSAQAKTAKALLRSDVQAIRATAGFAKHVVIAATIIHAVSLSEIDNSTLLPRHAQLAEEKGFTTLISVSLQQSHLETIVSHLREMADS